MGCSQRYWTKILCLLLERVPSLRLIHECWKPKSCSANMRVRVCVYFYIRYITYITYIFLYMCVCIFLCVCEIIVFPVINVT